MFTYFFTNQEQVVTFLDFLLLPQYLFLEFYNQRFYLQTKIKKENEKSVLTRPETKIKFIAWLKKVVPNTNQNDFVLIINSKNQELIYDIHCLEYKFVIKARQIHFVDFTGSLFYDLYFEFYSSNVSNIFYSIKHHCILHSPWLIVATTFSFTGFAFLCPLPWSI